MSAWAPLTPVKHAWLVRWSTHTVNSGWVGEKEFCTRDEAVVQRDLLLSYGCVTHVTIEETHGSHH